MGLLGPRRKSALTGSQSVRRGRLRQVSVFHKYSLQGDTTAQSGLFARLCHAFSSFIYNVFTYEFENANGLYGGDINVLSKLKDF